MPTQLSRRDLRQQQQFENDLATRQADQHDQAGFLQMLSGLYGIGQEQQFSPEKLRALQDANAQQEYETQYGAPARVAHEQAATQGQQYENLYGAPAHVANVQANTTGQVLQNANAPHEQQVQDEYRKAQIQSMQDLSAHRHDVPPESIPMLVQMGIMTKEEAQQRLLTPEQQAARQTATASAEQQKAAERVKFEAQQTAPVPSTSTSIAPDMLSIVPKGIAKVGSALDNPPDYLAENMQNQTPEARARRVELRKAHPVKEFFREAFGVASGKNKNN